MAYGTWPPAVWGNDVTYLINYFRGRVPACGLDIGFWYSADVNGDCRVLGTDVRCLLDYFHGIGSINHCCDVAPCWITPDSIPAMPPSGWPNCNYLSLNDEDLLPYDDNSFLDDYVSLWIGNLDGSPIIAIPGERVNIDVYIQTDFYTYGGDLHIPLGYQDQYFDSLLSVNEGSILSSFAYWDTVLFIGAYGSPPNQPGWSSESFMGWSERIGPFDSPYLNFITPTKILTFVAKTVNNPALEGDTIQCLGIGQHPSG